MITAKRLRNYLEQKNVEKLREIHEILSSLAESWKSIEPKT